MTRPLYCNQRRYTTRPTAPGDKGRPQGAAKLNPVLTRRKLFCNDKLSQRGGGALVLHSPLLALRNLAELLADDSYNSPLRAGEVISTGTLTLAMPVSPGETWTTKVRAWKNLSLL
jgi:2-keto-4-pentenoate hydratase